MANVSLMEQFFSKVLKRNHPHIKHKLRVCVRDDEPFSIASVSVWAEATRAVSQAPAHSVLG